MKKICIIGNLGNAGNENNGQTVKTKTMIRALTEKYGDIVVVADTNRINNNGFTIIVNVIRAVFKGDLIVLAVCNFAVKLLALPVYLLAKVQKKKIVYVLIGGWLGKYVSTHKITKWALKKYDVIFAETKVTGKALLEQGFANIQYLDNCKYLKKQKKVPDNNPKEVHFCTLSRVVPEKGIEDAIEAICEADSRIKEVSYYLDIYGEIEEAYKDEIIKIIQTHSNNISYKGVVKPEQCPEIISKYDALLFPTRVKTEGMPGTVIDAMFAGTPVIAVDWNACREVISDGNNGLIYSWDNRELAELLCKPNLKQALRNMQENCFSVADRFTPEIAMKPLFDLYNEKAIKVIHNKDL